LCEADRSFLSESGIDGSTAKDGIVTVSASAAGASSVSQAFAQGQIAGEMTVGGYRVDLNLLFKFIESIGKGEVLAQPVVVVRDGKTGRIQVGQDFSIKSRDYAGNVVDNFFSTGTILEVSPLLYHDDDLDFIRLDIHVERSSAIPDPVSTVVNKIQANSSVLLLSGESTIIGGLYNTIREVARTGVPGLKDLPPWVLGLRYIFGYNRVHVQHKELVILIRSQLLDSLPTRSTAAPVGIEERFEEARRQLEEKFRARQRELPNVPTEPQLR
jgi:general secretion pathway protein D